MDNVLITGVAGFIGFHLSQRLVNEGFSVIGIDNINDYYSPDLKYDRLQELGVDKESIMDANEGELIKSNRHGNFSFQKVDLADRQSMETLFSSHWLMW